MLFFSTKDYCIFWWFSCFTWQYWTLCFRYGTSSNDIKWYDMIRCLLHISTDIRHVVLVQRPGSCIDRTLLLPLGVRCPVKHNGTIIIAPLYVNIYIYIHNWVHHCTMEPIMESLNHLLEASPTYDLQLLKPKMEMACDTPRREIESHTNWGRPIRAWSNPFGDLYGGGRPGWWGKGTFTLKSRLWEEVMLNLQDNKNLAPEKCLQSENCNLSSHQLCGRYVAVRRLAGHDYSSHQLW